MISDEIVTAYRKAYQAELNREPPYLCQSIEQCAQDDIRCTRAALESVLPDLTAAARAEIDKLNERLENNHVFRFDKATGDMIREGVEPGSIPDGIEARDETIKLLDEQIARLRARVAAARAETWGEAANVASAEFDFVDDLLEREDVSPLSTCSRIQTECIKRAEAIRASLKPKATGEG